MVVWKFHSASKTLNFFGDKDLYHPCYLSVLLVPPLYESTVCSTALFVYSISEIPLNSSELSL